MMRFVACSLLFVMVSVELTGCSGGHQATSPPTGSATLQWDPNTDSDLAGYKVYRSTSSGSYGAPLEILPASVTTYQSTGLAKGVTYFFVISAYNSRGSESPLSNEVTRTLP
jgi:fibronectin type 3 domain-containing protein